MGPTQERRGPLVTRWWERFVRALGVVLACLLLAVIFLTLRNPFTLMLLVMVISPVAIALALVSLLYTMLYGRKRVILILRKFRNVAVNKSIRSAFKSKMKRKYRIVTLYDGSFSKIGLSRVFQAAVYSALPLLIFIVALIPVVLQAVYPVVPLISIEPIFGLLGPFFIGFMQPLLALHVCVMMSLIACVIVHRWRINWRAVLVVHDAPDLERLGDKIWSLSSWWRASTLMGAQSTLARSSMALWQQAVGRAANAAHGIVIDVSEPTESLVWEVSYCLEHHRSKTIIICDRDTIEQLTSTPLMKIITFDPKNIMAYNRTSWRGRHTFSNNLRGSLDVIKGVPPPCPKNLRLQALRYLLISTVVYFCAVIFPFSVIFRVSPYEFVANGIDIARFAYRSRNVPSMSLEETSDFIKEMRERDGVSAGSVNGKGYAQPRGRRTH